MAFGKLMTVTGNKLAPVNTKASDFPDLGASGPAGMVKGKNQVIRLTETQEGPMHTQDGGSGKPSEWGKTEGFAVGQAPKRGASVSDGCYVDLESGEHY